MFWFAFSRVNDIGLSFPFRKYWLVARQNLWCVNVRLITYALVSQSTSESEQSFLSLTQWNGVDVLKFQTLKPSWSKKNTAGQFSERGEWFQFYGTDVFYWPA